MIYRIFLVNLITILICISHTGIFSNESKEKLIRFKTESYSINGFELDREIIQKLNSLQTYEVQLDYLEEILNDSFEYNEKKITSALYIIGEFKCIEKIDLLLNNSEFSYFEYQSDLSKRYTNRIFPVYEILKHSEIDSFPYVLNYLEVLIFRNLTLKNEQQDENRKIIGKLIKVALYLKNDYLYEFMKKDNDNRYKMSEYNKRLWQAIEEASTAIKIGPFYFPESVKRISIPDSSLRIPHTTPH